MSIGNLKDSGNQGNNFPYQLAVLKGLSISQCRKLSEHQITESNAGDLQTQINSFFNTSPNLYLVSKSIVVSSTDEYTAFLTVAEL